MIDHLYSKQQKQHGISLKSSPPRIIKIFENKKRKFEIRLYRYFERVARSSQINWCVEANILREMSFALVGLETMKNRFFFSQMNQLAWHLSLTY